MASNTSDPMAGIDVWNTPMLPPPPGVTSNFINPESRAPMIRAGMYPVLCIMLVFVILRIYTRARLVRALGSDDYLCLLSAATLIVFSGLVLSYKPEGRHGWDIPIGEALINHYWLEAIFGSLLVYSLSNMFTKLTLLALYLRIFKPAAWACSAIWIGIVITILFYIATFIGYLGLCVRIGAPVWSSMQNIRCANNNLMISKAQGWYGLISDVYILTIPLSLVSRLKLNPRRKLGVIAVFLTGLAAVGISAASLAKRYDSVEQGSDRTWENCIVFLYTTLELAIGIICSCMPVIAVTVKNSMTNMNSIHGSEPPSQTPSKEHIPDIPSGTVSGLRSFFQRMYRSNNESKDNPTNPATLETLDSVDQHYHAQLKQMYTHGSNV
ncbi:hypothetical protein DL769_002508 [Monosporascus sp. CRB-8-3]|nr:hypothetical protein DL769_002508 [Monosporascus sp. CRB-8-3]